MDTPFVPSDNLAILIGLGVSLVILYQIYNKFSFRSPVASAARKLILVLAGTVIASGVLYYHIRTQTGHSPPSDTWVAALDTALAHTVLTLPVFLELIYITNLLGKVLSYVLAFVALGIITIGTWIAELSKSDSAVEKASCGLGFLASIAAPLALLARIVPVVLGTGWTMWLLFLGTMDLQLLLFGAYDRSLGWNCPTTFRFSVLIEHMRGIIQTLSGNEVISTIASVVALVGGLLLGIGSITEAVKNLGQEAEKVERVVYQTLSSSSSRPLYRRTSTTSSRESPSLLQRDRER